MRFRALVIVMGALVLAGCTSSSGESPTNCLSPGTSGDVTVFAASSLKNVLADVREEFLASHPCVSEFNVSFGSSGELAAQIVSGAPADIFLAANQRTKDIVLADKSRNAVAELIARNKMAILVNNKSSFVGSIQKLSDLQDVVNPGVIVGVCVESAPCGAILPSLLDADELTIGDIADTTTNSVQDLVTKVVMGELDAGIVFGSDCTQARRTQSAQCVDINQDLPNPITSPLYVVSLNTKSNTRDLATYLASNETKSLLQQTYGFLAP